MPAARYWRVVGISTYSGGDLELSDIALYSGGTRVDGSATFTSTFAPISAGRWAAADVYQPGFALQWDFGVAQDVDAVGMRGPSRAAFPYTLLAQYSTDAILWYDLAVYHRTKWYDASTFTVFSQEEYLRMINTDLLLDYDLSVGGKTSLPDRSIYNRTIGSHTGGAAYSTQTGGVFGNRLSMTQAGPLATITSSTPARYAGYTIESWLATSSTAQQGLLYAVESFLATSLTVGLNTNRNLVIATRASSVNQQSVSTLVAPFNQWFHLAVVIVGSEFRVYLSGQLAITHTDTRGILNANTSSWEFHLGFGGALVTYANLVGSADETRLYRAALYSANFTTQTAPHSVYPPFDADPQPRPSVTAPATRISEYTPPATVTSQIAPAPNRIDIAYGGAATVTGTVKRKADPANVPLRRRVRLYDENGRQFIREVWSDAVTGEFVFTDLNPAYAYTVVTYDYENNYRALTVDKVVAE